LKNQAAVEDELAFALYSRSVNDERERMGREVLAEHAPVTAVTIIDEIVKPSLK
jgi:hypothetical protein